MKSKHHVKLLFALFCTLLLVNCSSPESKVTRVVNKFYSEYEHNFRIVNKQYVSDHLYGLILKAKEIENEDAMLIKNSAFPTDKPLLIEGDVFTSLYEGHTSFTIKKTTITGNKATTIVEFKNKKYNQTWEDEVQLVNEKSKWKIDDVIFKKEISSFGSTQQCLDQIINHE